MIRVPLTRGYFAVVDDDDVRVLDFKWKALVRDSGIVYAVRSDRKDGRFYSLHRQVMSLGKGDPIVDHIDGDGLNCQKSNLRISNKSQNNRNVSGPRRNNKSGYLGVYPHSERGGYVAAIKAGGSKIYLGIFPTAEKANAARLKAEKELWGIQPRRAAAHNK